MNNYKTADQLLSEDAILSKQADIALLKIKKLKLREEKANDIIKRNVIQAMTAGLIPIPALDLMTLTHVTFKMTDDLLKLYNVHHDKIGISVIRSVVIGALPVVTITGLGSMVKFMPGIGSLIGSTSVAISAGGLTYALGKTLSEHFSKGGLLNEFSIKDIVPQFKSEFKEGIKLAKSLDKKELEAQKLIKL